MLSMMVLSSLGVHESLVQTNHAWFPHIRVILKGDIMLFLVCWGTKRISCQIMDLVRILLKLYVLRVYTARWEFYLSLLLLVTLKLFVNCLYKLSLIRFILSLQLFPPILIANPIGSLFSQHRKDKEPFKALEIYPSQKNEI